MLTDEEYRKIISKLKLGTPETAVITAKWNYKIFKEYEIELTEYLNRKLIEEEISKNIEYQPSFYTFPVLSHFPLILTNYSPNAIIRLKEKRKNEN